MNSVSGFLTCELNCSAATYGESVPASRQSLFLVSPSNPLKGKVQRVLEGLQPIITTLDGLRGAILEGRRGVVLFTGDASDIEHLLAFANEAKSPLLIFVDVTHASAQQLARWIHMGAVGGWSEDASDGEFKSLLERALNQEDKRWRRWRNRHDQQQRLRGLNDKELRVLRYVVNGCHNKWIAETLGISQRTVELRRHEIHEKTGTKNVAQLVRVVMEAGWDMGVPVQNCSELPTPQAI